MKSGQPENPSRTPVRVVIVEDEPAMREYLARLIGERPELRLVDMLSDGPEALERLSRGGVELVFMDIGLPGMDGIRVLEQLESLPYIIFITVSGEHASRAFDMGAVDFLRKPFSGERFHRAVERSLVFLRDEAPRTLTDVGLLVAEKGGHVVVPFQDIIYVSASDQHSVVHTESRDYESIHLLKRLGEKLPDEFFRIHRRFIINLKFLDRIQNQPDGRYLVFLKDNDETSLFVSRSLAPAFRERMGL